MPRRSRRAHRRALALVVALFAYVLAGGALAGTASAQVSGGPAADRAVAGYEAPSRVAPAPPEPGRQCDGGRGDGAAGATVPAGGERGLAGHLRATTGPGAAAHRAHRADRGTGATPRGPTPVELSVLRV
ncbi:hypothetical protein [Streptomyces sp. NPDC089919]|uniref:hypothetical protein n=1 Tax=Streptomyces sp. NPDC089919 TaxID=3155188 RepID=UPI0034165190